MSDYIKREDAVIEIERFAGYLDGDMLYRIKLALGRLPSADVVENVRLSPITTATEGNPIEYVEVVRCAHCKRYDRHNHRCKWFNHGISNIDYCSYGERKDDE